MRLLRIITPLVFSILAACQSTPKCGPDIRAAFDIGSGSTKMKVAEINTCDQTISKVLLDEQVKIDYRDALEKNPEGLFPEKVQKEGLTALEAMKMKARTKGARSFTGIATAAFRQAKNGEAFAKDIRTKVGIPVRVISQNEEAMLGFNAVVVKEHANPADIVVWDIGGGSQQMMALDEKSEPVIYYGTMASVSLKNHVIAKIQKKDVNKVDSPNPLKKSDVKKALTFIDNEAKNSVPENLRTKLSKAKVFGIGGVLAKSIPRQVGEGRELSQTNIQAALEKRTGMTDAQINDPYSATEVTNLILVYGFMKNLGFSNYSKTDVNLVDGLWLSEGIWQQ